MDYDLILSILQKGSILNNKEDNEVSKELLEKLKTSNNILLNPLIVKKLINILTGILVKCIELTATTTEAQLETHIIDLLHSWCQLSQIQNHEIYTTETLSVVFDELTKQFSEMNFNFDDLKLYRQCVKNTSLESKNTIEDIYEKRLQFKQKQHIRNTIQFEFSKKSFQSPLIQHKLFSESQYMNLTLDKRDVIKNKIENKDYTNIFKLITALTNLIQISDYQNKFTVQPLLEKVINHLFVDITDMNDFKPYFHVFYEENCHLLSNQPTKIQELIFIENAPPSFIEKIILEETVQVISQLKLQEPTTLREFNYNNYEYFSTLQTDFNKLGCKKLKKLFCFCSKSKQLFEMVSSILNELLIKLNFDFRVLVIIQSLVNKLKNVKHLNNDITVTCKLIDLYPEEYRDLVFHLDLCPETLRMLNLEDNILEKLFELYLEHPRVCLMLLSHFPAWISRFNIFFNHLGQ